jgi:hypothetical protein
MADLRARGIRVRAITDEPEQGGKRGVYKQHLEQIISGAGLPMTEIILLNRGGTKKDVRIREAAAYWLDNCVRIFNDVAHVEDIDGLKWQMTRIGRCRYKDISDACADVFRPEIYRGRHQYNHDLQPPTPVQPGDEVLKEQISRQLFPERHGVTFEDLFPESGERATSDEFGSPGPW